MTRAILMSIKPKWIAKILNGEKTIEVRKKFPKDYRGWVYIYCTRDNRQLVKPKDYDKHLLFTKGAVDYSNEHSLNGKVVARFWCDKVEEIHNCEEPYTYDQWWFTYYTNTLEDENDLLIASRLYYEELHGYLKGKKGYAIHISKLEIFDKPKELSEFMPIKWNKCNVKDKNGLYQCHKCPFGGNWWEHGGECRYGPLTKSPQSWQYIEI